MIFGFNFLVNPLYSSRSIPLEVSTFTFMALPALREILFMRYQRGGMHG